MIRRLRKFILITGTLLSVLIAAAFVVSAFRLSVLNVPGDHFVATVAGALLLGNDHSLPLYWSPEPRGSSLHLWNAWAWAAPYPFGFIPLYAVLAAVAIPTFLVWRFWPKPLKLGHCRCGYDLTGNTSGVCPECGQPFEAKGDAT